MDVEVTEQAKAEFAYSLDQRFRASLRAGREALWQTAEAAYQLYSATAWKSLGYESLNHYLADHEIGMSRSTFFSLKRAWYELRIRRQLDVERIKQLDTSKVDVVLPTIEAHPERLEEALDHAQALGKADLRELYRGTDEERAIVRRAQEREAAGPTGWTGNGDVPDEQVVSREAEPVVITDLITLSVDESQRLLSEANKVLATAGRRELIEYVEEVRDLLLSHAG